MDKELIKSIPLGCFAAFFVAWLVVALVAEKSTPPASGPVTNAINETGSCFTYAGVTLAITALIMVVIAMASGQH